MQAEGINSKRERDNSEHSLCLVHLDGKRPLCGGGRSQ
jgi:hypothetical protein